MADCTKKLDLFNAQTYSFMHRKCVFARPWLLLSTSSELLYMPKWHRTYTSCMSIHPWFMNACCRFHSRLFLKSFKRFLAVCLRLDLTQLDFHNSWKYKKRTKLCRHIDVYNFRVLRQCLQYGLVWQQSFWARLMPPLYHQVLLVYIGMYCNTWLMPPLYSNH